MPNSYVEYSSGLTETTYSIPFNYLAIADVSVKGFDGADWSDLTVASRDASAKTITLDVAPSAYQKIRVWRNTSTEQLVDFQNGSRLSERDLDTAYQQGLFVAQEVSENASTEVEGIGQQGPQGPQGIQGIAGTDPFDESGNLIVTSGNVGIGRPDPSIYMDIYTGSNAIFGGRVRSDRAGAQYFHTFEYAGSSIGSIQGASTSTSYNTTSDYRLKENVVDITDGITRVKQLEPKRFNFIADAGNTVDGFLAHEAQAVVPESVHGTKDEVDDEGNPVMQGIDQAKLVPLLTAALKEAIAKIEDLETRVEALENA